MVPSSVAHRRIFATFGILIVAFAGGCSIYYLTATFNLPYFNFPGWGLIVIIGTIFGGGILAAIGYWVWWYSVNAKPWSWYKNLSATRWVFAIIGLLIMAGSIGWILSPFIYNSPGPEDRLFEPQFIFLVAGVLFIVGLVIWWNAAIDKRRPRFPERFP